MAFSRFLASIANPKLIRGSSRVYAIVELSSVTMTLVLPWVRSIPETSPLMLYRVTLSGFSIEYQTHRFYLFYATTTSELGTHLA